MTVFALYNMKGGVGKTTSAVNLAYLSAIGGARTLLWDLDPQAAASYSFRVRPKVAGFGKRAVRDGEAFTAAIRGTDYEGLDLLPADFSYRKFDRILDRLDESEFRLARAVDEIGKHHDNVFLDCPPGLTLLTENVFVAADVILVPTIPTVLSLRTLARLLRHLKRSSGAPQVFAFLSMVDRRKTLHRRISAWARLHPKVFLADEIPYASIIEQMTVRRCPLHVYAATDPASIAFTALWEQVQVRVAEHVAGGETGSSQESIEALLAELGASEGEPSTPPVRPAPALRDREVASPNGVAGTDGREREFKLVVRSEHDVEALVRASRTRSGLSGGIQQLNHFFDTRRGDLRRLGCILRLREEGDRFLLTAKGPPDKGGQDGLMDKAEEEVRIDHMWAVQLLSGVLSPLDVLERRIGKPLPPLTKHLRRLVGTRRLRRVGSYQNLRRRLGPVALPVDGHDVHPVLEFDRTEFPGRRVDMEVEVEVSEADADACGRALRNLFARAGVSWATATSKARRLFEVLDASDDADEPEADTAGA